MKVFLVTDYFYPFNPGGTEWSVFELADSLRKKRINVKVVTLNYGAKSKEKYKGIEIIRINFSKKLNEFRKVVNPIWQNNPIFFIHSAIKLFQLVSIEKPDIIHVHGKFLIPASVIVGKLKRVPIVISIRDKQLLCPIGRCFFNTYKMKACNFYDYLTLDFIWFYQNYIRQQNLLSFIYTLGGSIWTKIAYFQIKFFAKNADSIVAISNSQKDYLKNNGFKKINVIYNSVRFKKVNTKTTSSQKIVFVGKLSKGKGAELLLDTFTGHKFPNELQLEFAGQPDSSISKEYLEKIKRNSKIKILGPIDHHLLGKLYLNSSAVVAPSIYPEAFGRVALEAQSFGVPVVVSDKGALKEIIKDKVTGRVVNLSQDSLRDAIIDLWKNERKYKENIKNEYTNLKNKFEIEPIRKHIELYLKLLK